MPAHQPHLLASASSITDHRGFPRRRPGWSGLFALLRPLLRRPPSRLRAGGAGAKVLPGVTAADGALLMSEPIFLKIQRQITFLTKTSFLQNLYHARQATRRSFTLAARLLSVSICLAAQRTTTPSLHSTRTSVSPLEGKAPPMLGLLGRLNRRRGKWAKHGHVGSPPVWSAPFEPMRHCFNQ